MQVLFLKQVFLKYLKLSFEKYRKHLNSSKVLLFRVASLGIFFFCLQTSKQKSDNTWSCILSFSFFFFPVICVYQSVSLVAFEASVKNLHQIQWKVVNIVDKTFRRSSLSFYSVPLSIYLVYNFRLNHLEVVLIFKVRL